MKKYQPALSDFNRSIELEPYFHGAFNNRGYVKFNLQDKRSACDDWRKALELGNKTVSKYLTKYCE
jgi:tetratricopeptide (TPR) repeat protein